MRKLAMVVVVLCFGACVESMDDASDEASDGEAADAPAQAADGKADGASFTGTYATSTAALRDGDVPNLELRADGSYVRRRCYHAGCALPVAQTDHFDTYTSSAGKTYVRFWSFDNHWNAAHDDHTTVPVIADVYELKQTSTGIKLRKARTSRWLTLRATTPTALCTKSGGSWDGSACACPGNTGWDETSYVAFITGLGGCSTIPGADEAECDATTGQYTDDDSTAVATYCLCANGSYLTSTGCTPL
jgi:hypothetical protein